MRMKEHMLIAMIVLMPAFLSAQTIEANQYMIWGIDEEEIIIPNGSIITEAVLTIHDIGFQENPPYVHLLDDVPPGILTNVDGDGGDFFDSYGVLLTGIYDGGKYIYRFSQNEHSLSDIRTIFPAPTSVSLGDSTTVRLSSALLELMDYAGNGGGLGIGIDADTKTDFTNITLSVQIQSYTQNSAPGNQVISLVTSYQQNLSFNGLVVVEAENFYAKVNTANYDWEIINSLPYSSGGAAMIASPDTTAAINTNYAVNSPRLDYHINFVQAGTYYVWVCGYAAGASSNTCHIGLDNQELASCRQISGFSPIRQWVWSSVIQNSSRATFVVSSAGEHVMNLWMCESKFSVDKIVVTNNPEFIPDSTSIADPFEQDENGLVTIEAEDFHGTVAQNGHEWLENTVLSGSSGEMAMTSGPDIGTVVDRSYAMTSPRLDYRINFIKTGTHYIWVRGYKTGTSDDSCHIGLNNQELSNCDRVGKFKKTKMWCWSSAVLDSTAKAAFQVSDVGEHTLNLWMRKDGLSVDTIVVTTNPNYVPDDFAQSRTGLITIEAEKYHNKVAQGGYDWSVFSDRRSSGKAAVIAVPGVDETVDTDYSTGSARLDFNVNFAKTGIHYIWIRGYTTDINRGSCHAGLDYQELDSCSRIGGLPRAKAWVCTNKKLDGELAVINVETAGEHVFNLWMRDSGFRVDKIYITNNPKYKAR